MLIIFNGDRKSSFTEDISNSLAHVKFEAFIQVKPAGFIFYFLILLTTGY
jgi:hypothetical protein